MLPRLASLYGSSSRLGLSGLRVTQVFYLLSHLPSPDLTEFLKFHIFICVCMHVSQRETCGSQFAPSTIQVLRIEPGSAGMAQQAPSPPQLSALLAFL